MKTDTFWNAVKQFKTDNPTRCYLAPVRAELSSLIFNFLLAKKAVR